VKGLLALFDVLSLPPLFSGTGSTLIQQSFFFDCCAIFFNPPDFLSVLLPGHLVSVIISIVMAVWYLSSKQGSPSLQPFARVLTCCVCSFCSKSKLSAIFTLFMVITPILLFLVEKQPEPEITCAFCREFAMAFFPSRGSRLFMKVKLKFQVLSAGSLGERLRALSFRATSFFSPPFQSFPLEQVI